MLSETRLLFVNRGSLLALGQLLMACGGQAVDGGGADKTGSGGTTTANTGGTETAGSGSDPSDGAGGTETAGTASPVSSVTTDTGTTGSSSELREAASERAARFVNDRGVACEHKQVTFAEGDQTSAYPTRVLQSRGHPGPFWDCGQLTDSDEKLACWERLSCDFEWWNELDWSQWSAGATVIEIVGVRPEQINVAATTLKFHPADPEQPKIEYTSFFETILDEPVPPGCHDCGYYWYLDPTPAGVALVLGPPMAGELEDAWVSTELNLCLTE